MRDLALFFDNTEKAYSTLNHNATETDSINSAVTDMVSEVLYYESCPCIVSKSLLQHFFELASIAEQLLESNLTKYQQNLQSFMIPRYNNTFLQDTYAVQELSSVLRRLLVNYKLLQIHVSKELISNPSQTVQEELENTSSKELFKKVQFFIPRISGLAFYLFKYFVAVEKIKSMDFEIFEIDDFFALIIPKSYLNKTKATMQSYLAQHNIETYNDNLMLGLKYQSLKKITYPFNPRSYSSYQKWITPTNISTDMVEALLHTQTNVKKILNILFLTPLEIDTLLNPHLKGLYEKYLWNIYIGGHGGNPSSRSTIAGIPEETFIDLLNYFNAKIKTNIVFTVSCFGAGERLKLFNIPNLQYILALGSSTKSVTIRPVAFKFNLNNQKKVELGYQTDISAFFKSLRENSGKSYFDVFNKIQSFWKLNKKQDKKFYSANIPHIKLPNTDWFQIIDLQKNEFNLNKLRINLHEYSKKPIIIKNKRLLFLNSTYKYDQDIPVLENLADISSNKQMTSINFPILLEGTIAPLVIPMDVADSKYNFSLLDGKNFALSHVALKFMGLSTQMYNRTFNIKVLTIKNPGTLKPYRGGRIDLEIFKKAMPIKELLHAGATLTLKNVTIKVRTTGSKPLFRLKFEYKGKRFIIAKSTYKAIKNILNQPKIIDHAKIDDLNNTISQSSIKLTNKKLYHENQVHEAKNFNNIEVALQKKLERSKQLAQNNLSSLQILSNTLSSLSLL